MIAPRTTSDSRRRLLSPAAGRRSKRRRLARTRTRTRTTPRTPEPAVYDKEHAHHAPRQGRSRHTRDVRRIVGQDHRRRLSGLVRDRGLRDRKDREPRRTAGRRRRRRPRERRGGRVGGRGVEERGGEETVRARAARTPPSLLRSSSSWWSFVGCVPDREPLLVLASPPATSSSVSRFPKRQRTNQARIVCKIMWSVDLSLFPFPFSCPHPVAVALAGPAGSPTAQ